MRAHGETATHHRRVAVLRAALRRWGGGKRALHRYALHRCPPRERPVVTAAATSPAPLRPRREVHAQLSDSEASEASVGSDESSSAETETERETKFRFREAPAPAETETDSPTPPPRPVYRSQLARRITLLRPTRASRG
jgi:hypothetical protein